MVATHQHLMRHDSHHKDIPVPPEQKIMTQQQHPAAGWQTAAAVLLSLR
jgi:hypothetical protein